MCACHFRGSTSCGAPTNQANTVLANIKYLNYKETPKLSSNVVSQTCASFHGSNIIPSQEQPIDLSRHVINTNMLPNSLKFVGEIEPIKIR
jgi:hypothetical protein